MQPTGRRAWSKRILEYFVVAALIVFATAVSLMIFGGSFADARDARRLSDVDTLRKALQQYYADHGDYPKMDWVNSADESWNTLGVQLAPYLTEMPQGPQNETAGHVERTGAFNYSYYSTNKPSAIGGKKDYVLVIRLEHPEKSSLKSDDSISIESFQKALGVVIPDTHGILFIRAP
jgi:type II secretory pathway pseudopilin PulG